jgi:hypothetical protein
LQAGEQGVVAALPDRSRVFAADVGDGGGVAVEEHLECFGEFGGEFAGGAGGAVGPLAQGELAAPPGFVVSRFAAVGVEAGQECFDELAEGAGVEFASLVEEERFDPLLLGLAGQFVDGPHDQRRVGGIDGTLRLGVCDVFVDGGEWFTGQGDARPGGLGGADPRACLVDADVQHVAGEGLGVRGAAFGVQVPGLDLGDQRVVEGHNAPARNRNCL